MEKIEDVAKSKSRDSYGKARVRRPRKKEEFAFFLRRLRPGPWKAKDFDGVFYYIFLRKREPNHPDRKSECVRFFLFL
ncbi:hypothetical protein CIB95_05500 [Lottiidibacillus patelloidae]|uniref:Uncharacterized protein n=1 Tax=Lottiidibacillus patelloidae TaxID=2670334 RepID=A0A263BWX1_9BACI|nr:hypothetical protein CIB95_05500 [Lottiidibacillus patelloidae]